MAFDNVPWLRWLPHPHFPEDGVPYKYRWPATIVVSLGVFLIALDITIVGVTGPFLSAGLGATATQIQWAFDAYTVVLAGFVVLGAELAERFGRKGIMQLGLLVFAIGSAISAFAPDPRVLIAGRIVSGLGAALDFPASLSIISSLFPPKERQKAISVFASISAVGLAGGPVIGGLLIGWFWWGAAFLVVVPPALLAIGAMGLVVPTSRRVEQKQLDFLGAVLSVLGLGGVVFGIIEGPGRGWGDPAVLITFSIGFLCLAIFVVWELRCKGPLFDLRVFKDTRVVGGALAMATVYFTFNSSQLLIPQYLNYVLNFSSVGTGLLMSPLGLALLILSPASGKLVERHGQRATLLFTLIFMAAGLMVLALLPFWGGVVNILVGICVYGVGFGLVVAPATSVIMVAIPADKAGDGSAVNMISRQIGGAIGVAITGSFAALVYRHGLSLSEFHLSDTARASVERSLSGVIALDHALEPALAARLDAMADAEMVNGVAVAMAVSALVTVLVAVVAMIMLPRGSEDR